MDKGTQAERILRYMETNGSITQIQALNDTGVMRLASRISDLRKRGYRIESDFVKVRNRYGEVCWVKSYRLAREAQN